MTPSTFTSIFLAYCAAHGLDPQRCTVRAANVIAWANREGVA